MNIHLNRLETKTETSGSIKKEIMKSIERAD